MRPGPTEVFPREKPRNAGCEKKGKALEKGGAAAHTKQEETRNRQNETTESLLPQSSSHVEQLPNMTKLGEQSLSNLNIASRDRSMTTGGGRRVDWGILAIQRRKEYRRQQKQKLLKKKTAKGSAQVLAKYPSKVSTLGEHPLVHHKELERPRLAYSTTQLQRSHTAHKLVATSLHKEDSNPHRESRRLPEDVQLRTAPSSGRLQTLDEMIKEEAEIARKKNIERYTSEFGLEEVASGNNQASDWHSRFCLVL